MKKFDFLKLDFSILLYLYFTRKHKINLNIKITIRFTRKMKTVKLYHETEAYDEL